MHAYIHTYVRTYIRNTYIHARTHTHTYTLLGLPSSVSSWEFTSRIDFACLFSAHATCSTFVSSLANIINKMGWNYKLWRFSLCNYIITHPPPIFSLYIGPHNFKSVPRMLVPGEQTPSETGLAMYVWRNTEARSSNHCCSGKAMSITYCVCVCVCVCVCP